MNDEEKKLVKRQEHTEDIVNKSGRRINKNSLNNLMLPVNHPDRPRLASRGPKSKTNKQAIKELMLLDAAKFPDKEIQNLAKKYNEEHGTTISVRDLMQAVQIKKAILSGDTAAYNSIQDREEGRPKQIQENLNLDMSFEDFLGKASDPEIDDKVDTGSRDVKDEETGGEDGTHEKGKSEEFRGDPEATSS